MAKRARRAASQGACVARGKRFYPPPSEIHDLDPPPSCLPREELAKGEREELAKVGQREEGRVGQREERVDEPMNQGMLRTPRGPGGRRIYR